MLLCLFWTKNVSHEFLQYSQGVKKKIVYWICNLSVNYVLFMCLLQCCQKNTAEENNFRKNVIFVIFSVQKCALRIPHLRQCLFF